MAETMKYHPNRMDDRSDQCAQLQLALLDHDAVDEELEQGSLVTEPMVLALASKAEARRMMRSQMVRGKRRIGRGALPLQGLAPHLQLHAGGLEALAFLHEGVEPARAGGSSRLGPR